MSEILQKVNTALPFELLKPTGDADIDERMLELFRSGFFKHFQRISEQAFFILDHRTMRYLYVSENAPRVVGFSMEMLNERGAFVLSGQVQPDDAEKFPELYSTFMDVLKSLSGSAIHRCVISYDFRMRVDALRYRWMLEHCLPLTVDESNRVVHALLIVSDSDLYKRASCMNYRIALYDGNQSVSVLKQGSLGEGWTSAITGREKEVLRLTAEGRSEKEIAEALGIAVQTVKSHRKNLLRKTGTKSSGQLVYVAMANLLI